MSTPPFKYVQAVAHLGGAQVLEFQRVAVMYRRLYNYLLSAWLDKAAHLGLTQVSPRDIRFLSTKLNALLSFTQWVAPGEKGLAYCACTEVYRDLVDASTRQKPMPQYKPETNHRIVAYKQFDAKVKIKRVMLPVIGQVTTERFEYFTGSIRAVGLEEIDGQRLVCRLYYHPNTPVPVPAVIDERQLSVA
jgi:hypothetical protein